MIIRLQAKHSAWLQRGRQVLVGGLLGCLPIYLTLSVIDLQAKRRSLLSELQEYPSKLDFARAMFRVQSRTLVEEWGGDVMHLAFSEGSTNIVRVRQAIESTVMREFQWLSDALNRACGIHGLQIVAVEKIAYTNDEWSVDNVSTLKSDEIRADSRDKIGYLTADFLVKTAEELGAAEIAAIENQLNDGRVGETMWQFTPDSDRDAESVNRGHLHFKSNLSER